eukprot:Nk52_evm25s62 gene=Nk52_evmTU25s62
MVDVISSADPAGAAGGDGLSAPAAGSCAHNTTRVPFQPIENVVMPGVESSTLHHHAKDSGNKSVNRRVAQSYHHKQQKDGGSGVGGLSRGGKVCAGRQESFGMEDEASYRLYEDRGEEEENHETVCVVEDIYRLLQNGDDCVCFLNYLLCAKSSEYFLFYADLEEILQRDAKRRATERYFQREEDEEEEVQSHLRYLKSTVLRLFNMYIVEGAPLSIVAQIDKVDCAQLDTRKLKLEIFLFFDRLCSLFMPFLHRSIPSNRVFPTARENGVENRGMYALEEKVIDEIAALLFSMQRLVCSFLCEQLYDFKMSEKLGMSEWYGTSHLLEDINLSELRHLKEDGAIEQEPFHIVLPFVGGKDVDPSCLRTRLSRIVYAILKDQINSLTDNSVFSGVGAGGGLETKPINLDTYIRLFRKKKKSSAETLVLERTRNSCLLYELLKFLHVFGCDDRLFLKSKMKTLEYVQTSFVGEVAHLVILYKSYVDSMGISGDKMLKVQDMEKLLSNTCSDICKFANGLSLTKSKSTTTLIRRLSFMTATRRRSIPTTSVPCDARSIGSESMASSVGKVDESSCGESGERGVVRRGSKIVKSIKRLASRKFSKKSSVEDSAEEERSLASMGDSVHVVRSEFDEQSLVEVNETIYEAEDESQDKGKEADLAGDDYQSVLAKGDDAVVEDDTEDASESSKSTASFAKLKEVDPVVENKSVEEILEEQCGSLDVKEEQEEILEEREEILEEQEEEDIYGFIDDCIGGTLAASQVKEPPSPKDRRSSTNSISRGSGTLSPSSADAISIADTCDGSEFGGNSFENICDYLSKSLASYANGMAQTSNLPDIMESGCSEVNEVLCDPLARSLTLLNSKSTSRASTKCTKRQDVVKELISSEAAYIEDLKIIISVFLTPLKKMLLSVEECGEIFGNIETILMLNTTLYDKISTCAILGEGRMDYVSDAGPIAKHFIDIFPKFMIYCDYCRAQIKVKKELDKYSERPGFASFVKECEAHPSCRRLSLSDFLVKPVQRLTKYPLLLHSILKYTPRSHIEYRDLLKAVVISRDMVSQINATLKADEESHRMAELMENLNSTLKEPLTGTESILFEEAVYVRRFTNRKKSDVKVRGVILSDRLLLLNRRKSPFRLMTEPILLAQADIKKDESDKKCFYIDFVSEEKDAIVHLRCSSGELRNKWVRRLIAAVQGIAQESFFITENFDRPTRRTTL